jgi:hypothetical protein
MAGLPSPGMTRAPSKRTVCADADAACAARAAKARLINTRHLRDIIWFPRGADVNRRIQREARRPDRCSANHRPLASRTMLAAR